MDKWGSCCDVAWDSTAWSTIAPRRLSSASRRSTVASMLTSRRAPPPPPPPLPGDDDDPRPRIAWISGAAAAWLAKRTSAACHCVTTEEEGSPKAPSSPPWPKAPCASSLSPSSRLSTVASPLHHASSRPNTLKRAHRRRTRVGHARPMCWPLACRQSGSLAPPRTTARTWMVQTERERHSGGPWWPAVAPPPRRQRLTKRQPPPPRLPTLRRAPPAQTAAAPLWP